jgi:hypothetical protein
MQAQRGGRGIEFNPPAPSNREKAILVSPPGFATRTSQPVASRYTGLAIPTTFLKNNAPKNFGTRYELWVFEKKKR